MGLQEIRRELGRRCDFSLGNGEARCENFMLVAAIGRRTALSRCWQHPSRRLRFGCAGPEEKLPPAPWRRERRRSSWTLTGRRLWFIRRRSSEPAFVKHRSDFPLAGLQFGCICKEVSRQRRIPRVTRRVVEPSNVERFDGFAYPSA